MPKAKGEKANRILRAALAVLAEKGYENATIREIAKAAGVSRGLLHYYFESKEDLVTEALQMSSATMVESTRALLSRGNSPEELVDGAVDYLRGNYEENPSFYRLLFELWSAGARSEKIRERLTNLGDHVIGVLREEIESAHSRGAITIAPSEAQGLATLVLAISDGLAFRLIPNRPKLKDDETWMSMRNALIRMLGADS